MTVRTLVVEDEPEMAVLLARGLRAEGYEVDLADNGIDAMSMSAAQAYDIAVLDVMLPGMSGFELCRRFREQNQGASILLLTARDAVDDRIRGLDAGADDYLTKPFAFSELAARLRALRRRSVAGTAALDIVGLQIDVARHEIVAGDRQLRLSRTEFDLLHLLAANADRVVPRTEIVDVIWSSAAHINPNIVDQYISYVRRKLDQVGSGVRIVTVRGVGFQLVPGQS